MMSGSSRVDLPLAVISWAIRKLLLILERLFVLLKYQFYKNTAVRPDSIRLPLVKVLAAVAFLYLLLNGNLSFSLGNGGQSSNSSETTGVDTEVAHTAGSDGKKGLTGSLAAVFSHTDYFADLPEDKAETRRVKAYIRRFKDIAVQEQEKFGIPASIKMAQAILESQAGKSRLARQTNNHFGIKCFSRTCKKGHCSNFGDDTHKDFFRNYNSAWESWRAHSNFLMNGKYHSLLKHGNDYKKWARGLKKLGYATAGHYDRKLIDLIERYHLDELDN
jgi:hypothetical protein